MLEIGGCFNKHAGDWRVKNVLNTMMSVVSATVDIIDLVSGEKQESGDSVYYSNVFENVIIHSNNSKQWEHINNDGGEKLRLAIEALGLGNSKGREYFVNKIKELETTELERKKPGKVNLIDLK